MHKTPGKQCILTCGANLAGFDRLQRGLDAPPPRAGAGSSFRVINFVKSDLAKVRPVARQPVLKEAYLLS